MAVVTDKTIVQAVERFFQRPEVHGNLEYLSNSLPGSADIFVAGGAVRILLISHKTGFNLSERVFQFIKMRLELATVAHLKKLFRAKVGKSKATAIMGDYDDLCKYPSYDAYTADHGRGS